MTETITYDGSEEAAGELTAEEQDSLAIGEQMEQEQEQLLAGKYKTAEELEKAYGELEKKLGESQETEEPSEPEQEEENKEADGNFLDRLWQEATSEYTEATIKELSTMDPKDLAQMHLEYRNANQPQQLDDKSVSQLKEVAGGEKGYNEMMGWAKQNLSEQEVNMYDSVMDRGDREACFFAVQALKYRMADETGVEGEMLTGKAPSKQGDSFKSQAEMVRAMNDPKYDEDPAYRQEVMRKLERSDNKLFNA
tara:strand:+ start:260 stop:1015 length:756 start_codon:yes stop_codon:yes gene_type:complete